MSQKNCQYVFHCKCISENKIKKKMNPALLSAQHYVHHLPSVCLIFLFVKKREWGKHYADKLLVCWMMIIVLVILMWTIKGYITQQLTFQKNIMWCSFDTRPADGGNRLQRGEHRFLPSESADFQQMKLQIHNSLSVWSLWQ